MLFWRAKHLTKFHIPTKNLCFRRNCYFFAQVIFILQRKKKQIHFLYHRLHCLFESIYPFRSKKHIWIGLVQSRTQEP